MTEEIIARLRSLDLSDGGSRSRLSAIASCFYQPTFGWTRGACEELRNVLIETLEDADGNDNNDNSDGCNCTHHRCDQHGRQVSYDVLGNERHKAVCRLRNMQMDTGNAIKKLAVALGLEWNPNNAPKSVALLQSRIIHLLGGDECNFSVVESYMDAMGEKSNPAETSNESTDHVSFDTRLKLKTYACIILEFADTLGIDYPNGSKITDVAAEIRKRLSVLMSECKVMGFAKSAEIAKPESEDGGKVTITDELRKFKGLINTGLTPEMAIALRVEINRIADRIDEQFDRICQQQETVLQATIDTTIDADKIAHKCYIQRVEKLERQRDHWHQQATDMMNRADAMEHERDNLQQTIDKMTVELESARAKNRQLVIHIGQMQGGSKKWREKCEALTAERDELQAKLEEMLKTHVELPKDENDEYIHVEDVMDGYGKTIEVVELRYGRSGWMLISRDGNGYADTFAFAHHHEPTVEQVIRDLTLGKITEAQAIERIEGIHG